MHYGGGGTANLLPTFFFAFPRVSHPSLFPPLKKDLMIPSWLLLRALLALLPYAALDIVGAKPDPSISATTSDFASRTTAWVTPLPLLLRGTGDSRSRGLRCTMRSTAGGGGGGSVGNQASHTTREQEDARFWLLSVGLVCNTYLLNWPAPAAASGVCALESADCTPYLLAVVVPLHRIVAVLKRR